MTVVSLPSRSDFDAVFESPDAKASNRDFLVLAKLNRNASAHRIGFVTSKKKIRRAVDRNRFRRVIREYLRSQWSTPHSDIVVIARQVPDSLRSPLFQEELSRAFTKLFKRLENIDAE
ncbi:MAG: ribonuclease P protein component [Gammaproteobacteria bacterium]|nr:ribonuclease P protein component [Gammaproteobacteria bacterium]